MNRLGVALVVTAATSGCGLSPQPECVDASCCPAWSELLDGSCIARRWSATVPLADDASIPRVAIASDGEIAATWIASDAGRDSVCVAHDRDAFAPSCTPAAAIDARIAAGPNGAAHVVWTDTADAVESVIRHGARSAGAWHWTSEPLSFPPFADEPDVVTSASGEVLMVWNQWTGDNRGVAVARGFGDTPLRLPSHVLDVLSPLVNFSNNPEIALNPDGQAAIVWFQAADDVLDTFVSERHAGSEFFDHPAPTAGLSTGPTDVDNPVIALGPRGQLAAVWRQELGDGQFALFVATRQPGAAWNRPTSLDDRITEPADVVFNTQIGFTSGGQLYIVWQEKRGEDKGVYVLHRLADGVWHTPPRHPFRLSDEAVEAFDPSLGVGAHGVMVSWTEREDDDSRVVSRRSFDGLEGPESARWGSLTRLSATGTHASASHVAIGGSQDRVACVWAEGDSVVLATVD